MLSGPCIRGLGDPLEASSMPTSSEVRERRILQLVEWACLSRLEATFPSIVRSLFDQAKELFLVTDETADDYSRLALKLLQDPLRCEIEVRRMRVERAEPRS